MTGLDSDALLPCPFCGGEAGVRSKMVGCFNMECWGPAIMHFASVSEAIAAWNRRAALPPGWDDAIEAAVKVCDDEADRRFANAQAANFGDTSWGVDLAASRAAQDNKAITARSLAVSIRALKHGSE